VGCILKQAGTENDLENELEEMRGSQRSWKSPKQKLVSDLDWSDVARRERR